MKNNSLSLALLVLQLEFPQIKPEGWRQDSSSSPATSSLHLFHWLNWLFLGYFTISSSFVTLCYIFFFSLFFLGSFAWYRKLYNKKEEKNRHKERERTMKSVQEEEAMQMLGKRVWPNGFVWFVLARRCEIATREKKPLQINELKWLKFQKYNNN